MHISADLPNSILKNRKPTSKIGKNLLFKENALKITEIVLNKSEIVLKKWEIVAKTANPSAIKVSLW